MEQPLAFVARGSLRRSANFKNHCIDLSNPRELGLEVRLKFRSFDFDIARDHSIFYRHYQGKIFLMVYVDDSHHW